MKRREPENPAVPGLPLENSSELQDLRCHQCHESPGRHPQILCSNPICRASYCRRCLSRWYKYAKKLLKKLPSDTWRCPKCQQKCICSMYWLFFLGLSIRCDKDGRLARTLQKSKTQRGTGLKKEIDILHEDLAKMQKPEEIKPSESHEVSKELEEKKLTPLPSHILTAPTSQNPTLVRAPMYFPEQPVQFTQSIAPISNLSVLQYPLSIPVVRTVYCYSPPLQNIYYMISPPNYANNGNFGERAPDMQGNVRLPFFPFSK